MAIKLFFMDLEGTLVVPHAVERPGDGHGASLWSQIFAELGPEALAEDDIGLIKWENKEHTYIEWCEYSLALFKKYGLTQSKLDNLIANTDLSHGVIETVAQLHTRGIRTAIISGGLMNQARKTQQALNIPHAYAASELYFHTDGSISGWNILPGDHEAKVDFVELLRRECNLTKEECAFIGDGKNDAAIAKHVGLSFAYRAHPKLQEAATYSINEFTEVLKHI